MAPIAVASTRSSAPTSASISGRFVSPPRSQLLQDRIGELIEPGEVLLDGVRNDRPIIFRYSAAVDRRSVSTQTSDVSPARLDNDLLHATHENHLDRRPGERFRRHARRADRRRHRHLPPEFLARHPRVARRDVRRACARRRARARREVAILQDLGGPKIRTGPLEGGRPLQLNAGDTLRIATGEFVGRPRTRLDAHSRGWRAACAPAIGCCWRTA